MGVSTNENMRMGQNLAYHVLGMNSIQPNDYFGLQQGMQDFQQPYRRTDLVWRTFCRTNMGKPMFAWMFNPWFPMRMTYSPWSPSQWIGTSTNKYREDGPKRWCVLWDHHQATMNGTRRLLGDGHDQKNVVRHPSINSLSVFLHTFQLMISYDQKITHEHLIQKPPYAVVKCRWSKGSLGLQGTQVSRRIR